MKKRKKLPMPEEKVFSLLQTGEMYTFRDLAEKAGLTKPQLDAALNELRKIHRNIRYLKFSRQYQLDRTPTPYFQLHNFSHSLPLEGAIGLISDTHLGSVAERMDIVEHAYDIFKSVGISHVFHAGDLTDGGNPPVYPGHSNHIHCAGDDQLAYVIAKYPRREGIVTHFIGGNHDLKGFQKSGVDPLSKIITGFEHRGKTVSGRTDMDYLGQMGTQILMPHEIVMDLLHPDCGFTYAKSYKQQKRSETMSRESRPDIQVSGHLHDFNHCWIDGTAFIAMPGVQDATEFFRRRGFSRQVGFVVMHYEIKRGELKYVMVRPYMFG